MEAWLAFAGAAVTALLAGLFGLVQSQRSATTQRRLELLRNESARRQQIIIPFFESLNLSLTRSYDVIHFPHTFHELIPVVPELKSIAEAPLREWIKATIDLYNQRMKALLAVDEADLVSIGSLLATFAERTGDLIATRNEVLEQRRSDDELFAVHTKYVRSGFELMHAMRRSVLSPGIEEGPAETSVDEVSTLLATTVKGASVALIPTGEQRMYSWVAIWWANKDRHEELTASLGQLADAMVDSNMNLKFYGIERSDAVARCLVARFPSALARDGFIGSDLPSLRSAHADLWVEWPAPYEFTV